ncbi:MAG: hypothetical protein NZ940_07710 [Candidatus Nezhaarchaeota archaeon]|nr:hypothetical protein [Candidatus Nezhaarchaeota archaeon]
MDRWRELLTITYFASRPSLALKNPDPMRLIEALLGVSAHKHGRGVDPTTSRPEHVGSYVRKG